MDYTISDSYHRKGNKVWITVKISGFEKQSNLDQETYDSSYAWAEGVIIKSKFLLKEESVRVYSDFPVPSEVDFVKIENLFNESEIAKRIVRKLHAKQSD